MGRSSRMVLNHESDLRQARAAGNAATQALLQGRHVLALCDGSLDGALADTLATAHDGIAYCGATATRQDGADVVGRDTAGGPFKQGISTTSVAGKQEADHDRTLAQYAPRHALGWIIEGQIGLLQP